MCQTPKGLNGVAPSHAAKRAKERYGVDLSQETLKVLEAHIKFRTGDVEFVCPAVNGCEVWRVPLGDQHILVAYNDDHGVIMTVLPPENRLRNQGFPSAVTYRRRLLKDKTSDPEYEIEKVRSPRKPKLEKKPNLRDFEE